MAHDSVDKRNIERFQVRAEPEVVAQVDWWAKRKGISRNEYVLQALDEMLDKDVNCRSMTFMEDRMNQLIGVVVANSDKVDHVHNRLNALMKIFISTFRGDNFLLDTEDD